MCTYKTVCCPCDNISNPLRLVPVGTCEMYEDVNLWNIHTYKTVCCPCDDVSNPLRCCSCWCMGNA